MSVPIIPGIPSNPRTLEELRRAFQRLAALLKLNVPTRPPLTLEGKYLSLLLDASTGLHVNEAGELAAHTFTFTAGEDLSGDRLVALAAGKVHLASASTTQAGQVVGLTRHAAIANAPVQVLREGLVSGLYGLTPGAAYFLAEKGAMDSTQPAGGLLQCIGMAISATDLALNLGVPLMRAID